MLQHVATWFTGNLLGIDLASQLGASVLFFIYENLKIFLLLVVLTHLMGVVRFFLPVEKMRAFLSTRKLFGADYFFASLFGVITPFCSCSSIPLFISFAQSRIPLGLTFAFLITSPLINEVALVLFISAFGLQVTLLYAIMGMAIGMLGGIVIQHLHLEREVASDLFEKKPCCCSCKQKQLRRTLWRSVSREAWSIVRKVMPYVLVGVGIGAAIHGYVPANYFEEMLAGTSLWSVPLAVILAVPLYANASAAVPITAALVEKGVALGTAIAFMMAVVGLSLPEALILKRAMSWKLLGIFFGIVTIGIIFVGYGFTLIT